LTVNQIEHMHLDNIGWNLYPPSYSVFSYESGELDGTYILPPILYLVMSLEN